jgi:hypothetical protein
LGEDKRQLDGVAVASLAEQFVAVDVVFGGEGVEEGQPSFKTGPPLTAIFNHLNGILPRVQTLHFDINDRQPAINLYQHIWFLGPLIHNIRLIHTAIISTHINPELPLRGHKEQIEATGREIPIAIRLVLLRSLQVWDGMQECYGFLLVPRHDCGGDQVGVGVVDRDYVVRGLVGGDG